ncbi:hypothetical protein WICMUC_001267 [Wickerhamomyces mucosus]|uniref:Vps72/YL1 C-terminal domain-containing protein n=1 Tax=Wickerhamomyces mucosus TaxID=1378264 RepID=A0A9P8PVS4_9ASCO|nr:hypothetical protein WICMUC_001267 [Wickerhamomyces mucosus]
MSDEQSLVATRKRRANAGSRLKQLLQAEEIANVNEEDEDVDLLFQEDEDDAEFQIGDKDIYGASNDEEEEEGNKEEDDESEVKGLQHEEIDNTDEINDNDNDNTDESESGEQVDNDDMFSDSDDDENIESDSDEGEKELQKQERAKKRKQSKAKQIPKITARPLKPITEKKKSKKYESPNADTLLSLTRRSSSRKAAVENKLNLVSRLKDEETRRQNAKQVTHRIEYIEMTQEERLVEALETEKYNITQLNKYKEQEVDKQAKRRALQMSKRKKLENIFSFKTEVKFVTLIEELNYENFLKNRDKLKKKDRRGRKSDKQKREEEEARIQEELRKERLQKLQNSMKEKRLLLGDEVESKRVKLSTPDFETDEIQDVQVDQLNSVSNELEDFTTLGEEVALKKEDSVQLLDANLNQDSLSENLSNDRESPQTFKVESEVLERSKEQETNNKADSDTIPESDSNVIVNEKIPIENEPIQSEVKQKEVETTAELIESKGEFKEELGHLNETNSPEVKKESDEKRVKFSDELDEGFTREKTVETSVEPEDLLVKEDIYEGPQQMVGANFLSFENKMTSEELKVFLFGPDANLPASRRFKEVEPILRVERLEEVKIQDINLPNFDILQNYAEFGDYTTVKKEKVILEARKDIKIVLKTQSPTGIYLPNGSKKQCLITGKPAMYFDPKTGMPYSSVEAYKVLQRLETNEYQWVEFPNGGSYVSCKYNERHAKGVPDGFDE